ncbi:MAG TPA: YggS family pyridoxal phosphate-dependent enzyme [Candidatus Dormibacteraeota bacterium]|nr:YggS family pyridoxal phosphate-dependent enzyme [Candidatus Dormibacteraeota bacterium]
MPGSIGENLEAVRETIARSAERAGRDPTEVVLVAVTKTFPVERIREALAHGLRILGENRVQEALPKIEEIGPANVDWHLIGHLQTNKVKFIDGRFRMVQSLDAVGLVEALDRRIQSPLDVLVEVNVAEEPQKTGVLPADLGAVVHAVSGAQHLRLRGLMTVAPMVPDPEAIRPVFRQLRSLRDTMSQQLGVVLPVLSMGMTDDYAIAVEEGATMLRLGRALFGPR